MARKRMQRGGMARKPGTGRRDDQTDGHKDEEGEMNGQTVTRMRGDCETDGLRGKDDQTDGPRGKDDQTDGHKDEGGLRDRRTQGEG
jgi:hypothetical protein